MEREKAILAGFRSQGIDLGEPDDPYIELVRLADTSGAEVVETITQPERRPTPQFLIGTGKVKEIHERLHELDADIVIFNHELTPLQFRNLERELGVKILDRTQLILDIFAMRAQSREGRIQVELAQLEYLLPRITGRGVELSRLGGGIGTRGPGETKLEVDRRRIRTRIGMLKKSLAKVEKTRGIQAHRRRNSGATTLALVGYTNAGKSTLFNKLTAADAFVEDKLFATLDPLTRRVYIPGPGNCLITDTVGFIANLPKKLMETFKSTLEGIRDADVLLHVADISNPQYLDHIREVESILVELGAHTIPTVLVFNKADTLDKPDRLGAELNRRDSAVGISARTGQGLDDLKSAVAEALKNKPLYAESPPKDP
jgi:GTP-binding protein HflX